MKLCFGTYTSVILRCGIERITRIELLNTIVRSVDSSCELTSMQLRVCFNVLLIYQVAEQTLLEI